MPAPDGEPTLADVQRQYPDWACWQSTGGLLYARRRHAPAGRPDVWGHDPPSLRDAITGFQPAQEHDSQAWTPARDTL